MAAKNRSDAMQERAMEIVQIRPLSAEAQRLIDEALAALELEPEGNRWRAFRFLQESGGLADTDVGGEILNEDEAIAALMEEFGCVKSTARSHVARAARRKRHPDYQVPQRGGRREGAGNPQYTDDQVRDMRRLAEMGATYAAIAEAFDTDPGNAYRIVNRETYKHVA